MNNSHVADPALPGENEPMPSALAFEWFPSRLHAFVWRNWTVVPLARLAAVLKTRPENLARIAASMGLPAQGPIQPEWQRLGYITVLRRNWHLLPYGQLLELLGFSRGQLREALQEDDFLYVKLGCVKPRCAPLAYQKPTPEEEAAAARIARWLREEGVAEPPAGEEPRFAFREALAAPVAEADVSAGKPESAFELRMIYSYCAEYGDPLLDPEVRSYPEGLLQRLAASGVNAVWVHTVLRTLARDPAFPEFGDDCERRIAGLRALVARAARHGLAVYLYVNEPRAMPLPFFEARPERAALRGVGGVRTDAAEDAGSARLCTSHPEVRRWLADALASVFSQVPGLGGVFTITASENPTHCASHGRHKDCPNCRGRTAAEIIAEVNATIAAGVWRGNPEARVIVWDWAWDFIGVDAHIAEIFERLPKGCWFMSVSEKDLPFTRGGVAGVVDEYSISAVGPGPRATRHWALARAAGLKTVAKVQAGTTWELGSLPYLPTMDLVAEHARNLAAAGVNGLMLSWSLGGYPSPNLEVFQAFATGLGSVDPVLDRLAEKRYGRAATPLVRQAWRVFSEGFREFPFGMGVLYNGPQHMGPANPLFPRPTGYRASMVGYPYDDAEVWRGNYPLQTWIGQMERVRDGFARGCELFAAALETADEARRSDAARDLGLFQAATLHFASCVNQARFVMIRNALDAPADPKTRSRLCEELTAAARNELDAAKALLALARRDSRIGYEPTCQYFYIPQDLLEKIVCCRKILDDLSAPRIPGCRGLRAIFDRKG